MGWSGGGSTAYVYCVNVVGVVVGMMCIVVVIILILIVEITVVILLRSCFNHETAY